MTDTRSQELLFQNQTRMKSFSKYLYNQQRVEFHSLQSQKVQFQMQLEYNYFQNTFRINNGIINKEDKYNIQYFNNLTIRIIKTVPQSIAETKKTFIQSPLFVYNINASIKYFMRRLL